MSSVRNTFVSIFLFGLASLFSVSAVASQKSDLTVIGVSRAETAFNTTTLASTGTLYVRIQNDSSIVVAKPFYIRAYFGTAPEYSRWNANRQEVGSVLIQPPIGPRQVKSVEIRYSGISPFADAPVSIYIDPERNVDESDRGNNSLVLTKNSNVGSEIVSPPSLKWWWRGSAALPGYIEVDTTPITAPLDDTNGDGKVNTADEPRVVVVSYPRGQYYSPALLSVLSGKTGAELRAATGIRVEPGVAPAVADIDGDGRPEIIAVLHGGGLVALNADLTVKWTGPAPALLAPNPTGGIYITDLDGDGKAEIIYQNQVFNFNGTLRFTSPSPFIGGYCCGFQNWSVPVVTRLTAGGAPVILWGASAVSANGALLWSNAAVGDGYVSIADLDKDGIPEIVVAASQNRLFYLRPDGSIKIGPIQMPAEAGFLLGQPVIADFDGDGFPDVGLNSGLDNVPNQFTAVDRNGRIFWTTPTERYIGPVAATAFDFAKAGTYSPILTGYSAVYMFRGNSGSVSFALDVPSHTLSEGPTIVDVDGDGSADIVVGSNWGGVGNFSSAQGVYVFSSRPGFPRWANTRKIWNQHAYSISNIGDDLRVARNWKANWQDSNTFRVNVPQSSDPVIDLSASKLRLLKDFCGIGDADDSNCDCDRHHVSAGKTTKLVVRVGNSGDVSVRRGVSVAVYATRGTSVTLVGVSRTDESLSSGEYEDVLIPLRSIAGYTKLVAVVDDGGRGDASLVEANRANNRVELIIP